jgi:hypothetical protein
VRHFINDYLRVAFKLFVWQLDCGLNYMRVAAVTSPAVLGAIGYQKATGVKKAINAQRAAVIECHFDIKSFSLRNSCRTAGMSCRFLGGSAPGSTF